MLHLVKYGCKVYTEKSARAKMITFTWVKVVVYVLLDGVRKYDQT